MTCKHCNGSFRVVRYYAYSNSYGGLCGFCEKMTWFKEPPQYDPPYPLVENEPKPRLTFSEMLILAKIAQLEIKL